MPGWFCTRVWSAPFHGLWAAGAAAAAAAVAVAMSHVGTVGAAEPVLLPFAGGEAVRVIQGYNGGTHQGRSRYALDLVLARGGTSGTPVVSPVAGLVAWAQAPGAGTGCLAVALPDGSYSVVACHVLLDHVYRPSEAVARGQSLGTVGPPGSVGNNGTAHVHLELHRGRQANNPVPFGGPGGVALDGTELPASGAANEHAAGTFLVSSNAPSSRAREVAPAPAVAPRAPPPQTLAPPAVSPAPTAPERRAAREQSGGAPAAVQVAAAAPVTTQARSAVVQGTGACLKIRDKPSLDAAVLDCVLDGIEMRLGDAVEQSDSISWRQIPGKGWAAADFLRRTRAVITGTGSCLNVRDVPSTIGAVLTCIPEGTSVAIGESVQGELGGWVRVDRGIDGAAGWVLGGFLS